MQITELTPQSASYRGNRSVCGLERILPADWLSRHEFMEDEVEVYVLDDALVLLAGRAAPPKLPSDFFKQLTVGWAPVDWWRTKVHSPSPQASIAA